MSSLVHPPMPASRTSTHLHINKKTVSIRQSKYWFEITNNIKNWQMGRIRPMVTYNNIEGIFKRVTPSSPRIRHLIFFLSLPFVQQFVVAGYSFLLLT